MVKELEIILVYRFVSLACCTTAGYYSTITRFSAIVNILQ